MAWRLRISRTARKQIENLPQRDREYVVHALERLATDPYSADIQKLSGRDDEWRLRVGQWRIRFTLDPATQIIDIYRVLPRGRACRD